MIKFLKKRVYSFQIKQEIKRLDAKLKQFEWVVPAPDKNREIIYTQSQIEAKRLSADKLYFIAKRQQELLNQER